MKGGITSGVVYPRAVGELAAKFRFKSVGGTSAGAIAAAAAAAAEHGRATGGFDGLAELPDWIGRGDNLSRLFQPQDPLRGLFALLLASVDPRPRKPLRIVAATLRHYGLAALLGALPGVALLVLTLVGDGGAALTAAGALGGLALALAGVAGSVVVWLARRVSRALPERRYGMCSGMPEGDTGREALTPWLADLVDRLAGRPETGAPLTFGDLWRGPDGKGTPEDPALRLEMMTTNLTNRRTERLPWGTREFLFDPVEWRELFPERVVAHMEAHPPPLPRQPSKARAEEERRAQLAPLRPLPDPSDLPVIVATRMSLSFPILLQAVPLWRVDLTLAENERARRAGTAPKAERCWFSDGGIGSNFPVHFFDAPLPRHPTFGINLRPYRPDQKESKNQADNVWMAERADVGMSDWWYRLEPASKWGFDLRIGAFLGGIVRTMQNRVDEAQMRVPGFRERVLHMSMSDSEGGMNLAMPPEVLDALLERGRAAGQRMARQFETETPDTPGAVSWDEHRWVRLRSTLAATADLLAAYRRGHDAGDAYGGPDYETMIERGPGDPPDVYRLGNQCERDLARDLSRTLLELASEVDAAACALETTAPSPRPALRLVPQDMPPRADPDA